MRLRLLTPLFVVALVLLAACGSEDSAPTVGGNSAGVTDEGIELPEIPDDAVDLTGQRQVDVTVGDNNYEPQVILVSPGTDVVWTNTGRNSHNVISSAEVPDFEQIDTEVLDDGGTGTRTFDEVGAYPYYCSIHGSPTRGQRGSIVVLPAAA